MSKINLSLNGDRAFGKYLPSVFISNIAVRNREDDPDGATGPASSDDLMIDVTLNINLTKSKELNDPAAYIEEYLGDLCLYGWINNVPSINEAITQKDLYLKDLFELFSASEMTWWSDFSSDSPSYEIIIGRLKQIFADKWHNHIFLNADGSWPTASEAYFAGGDPYGYRYASKDEILAGLEDPGCVWHYLFYGELGPDGPWANTATYDVEGAYTEYGDLLPTKMLHYPGGTEELEFRFGEAYENGYVNMKKSWLRSHIGFYLSFFTGAETSHADADDHVQQLYYKIPLRDLLIKSDLDSDTSTPDANPYGAEFWIQNVYDEEGNELVQISGIKMSFAYQLDGTTTFRLNRHNTYFIGTIGIDVDLIDDDERPTRAVDEFLHDSSRSLFNNYFGNISYEHVLENNTVPTQYMELWEHADNNEPYDDVPIQNLNGKYYVKTPVGQTEIIDSFNSLLGHYSVRAEADSDLKENLEKLSNILNLYATDVNLLTQISLYRQTYAPRGPSTPSGWFYRDLLSLLSSLTTRIGVQRRVLKRLARVGIVTDYRAKVAGWYTPPHPSGPLDGSGALTWAAFDRIGDDFIPSLWAEMSRQAFEHQIDTGGPDPDGMWSYGTGVTSDYMDLYNDIFESMQSRMDYWLGLGFTETQIREWAQTAAYIAYHRGIVDTPGGDAWQLFRGDDGGGDGGAGMMDLFDPYVMSNSSSDSGAKFWQDVFLHDYWVTGAQGSDINLNIAVRNEGTWWFEWEKALSTQSLISHVFRLNLLGRYFRMRIPYKYFPVKNVVMRRVELGLNADGGHSGVGDYTDTAPDAISEYTQNTTTFSTNMWVQHEITPDRDAPQGAIYPRSDTCIMTNSGFDGGADNKGYFIPMCSARETRFDADGDGHSTYSDALINYTRGATPRYSWLSYVPVDTAVDPNAYVGTGGYDGAGGDESLNMQTLLFYGYAAPSIKMAVTTEEDGVTTTTYEYNLSGHPMDLAIDRNLRIRNGYRLMCFQYKDMMDDDIAYYNTLYKEDANRIRALEALNGGYPNTTYFMTVEVEDHTLRWYTEIFYPWVKEQYLHFYDYYLFAEEFCSFNNITNHFNQFFVDAMAERYPTGDSKQWVRAALIAVLLRELLYQTAASDAWESGGYSDAELREIIKSDVLKIVKTISPEEGNLESLREFNCRYQLYLRLLKPSSLDGGFEEFCDLGHEESPVFNRACEMAGVDPASETAWEDITSCVEDLSFSNRIPIDQPIYGNYLLNAYEDDTVGFTDSVHPVALYDDQIYLTVGNSSGPPHTNDRYKVYINNSDGSWLAIGFATPHPYGILDPRFSRTPTVIDWGELDSTFRHGVIGWEDHSAGPGVDGWTDEEGIRLMFVPEGLTYPSITGGSGGEIVRLDSFTRDELLGSTHEGSPEHSGELAGILDGLMIEIPKKAVYGAGGTDFFGGEPERDIDSELAEGPYSTGLDNWLSFRPEGPTGAFSAAPFTGTFEWDNYRNLAIVR